jgi:hypothetical protein
MKIWVDDVRVPPKGYGCKWLTTVNQVKNCIMRCEEIDKKMKASGIYLHDVQIELIDLDHDAGSCAIDGGDYIRILDWLEETGRNYPIRLHSANPVGVENMRRIIERNGWTEVK